MLLFFVCFLFPFSRRFFLQLPLVAARAINSGSIAREWERSRGLLDMRSTQINRVPLHSCLFALKLYGALYLWLGWQVMPAMLPHLHHSLSLCLFRTLYTWTMLEINVINARKCSNSVISWPQALPCCERFAPVCVCECMCVCGITWLMHIQEICRNVHAIMPKSWAAHFFVCLAFFIFAINEI